MESILDANTQKYCQVNIHEIGLNLKDFAQIYMHLIKPGNINVIEIQSITI